MSEDQFERLQPLLPEKISGVARVDDRHVISGIIDAANCRAADLLLEDLAPRTPLLADEAYDANPIRDLTERQGAMPSKADRRWIGGARAIRDHPVSYALAPSVRATIRALDPNRRGTACIGARRGASRRCNRGAGR